MGMSTLKTSPLHENLNWNFHVYDDFEKELNADNEILTALVRTSYLKHLQKSLTNNFDLWFQKNEDNEDFNEICQNDIMKCANFIEHKALRACMITSYYRQYMIKILKEIKQSTEEGSLFSPLIEQIFDKKCTLEKQFCDKETQTNELILSEKKQSFEIKETIKAPTVETSLENSNLIVINPCSDIVPDKGSADDIEDLFNILMHSPSQSEPEKILTTKKRKFEETEVNGSLSSSFISDNDSFRSNLEYITPKPQNNEKRHSRKMSCDSSLTAQSESRKDIVLPKNENKKKNLDERLQSLAALFGEDSPNASPDETFCTTDLELPPDNNSITSVTSSQMDAFALPLDWKAEYVAQNCHLKKLLSQMSSARRFKVHKLFKRLFGSDRSLHTYISINEEALSRKRTATLVVGELTPHYIAGRIASREVFKALAKKITDELISLSYVSGTDQISAMVSSYFQNGNCINSVKDFAN